MSQPLEKLIPSLLISTLLSLAACGGSEKEIATASIDDSLLELMSDTGLEVVDLSVPFERLLEAPEQLRIVDHAIDHGPPPGLYVMRYYDTLRHTLHVFGIHDSKRFYIELSSRYPDENVTRKEYDIRTATFDEPTGTLILETTVGPIRIAPADVTSVGA